ncbi:hypothetical protein Hypma_004152 [Hypsizygus marmoreus]|nr:hypothetical protein Hypma_004152 [Hypsizygus marmoreus]
MEAGELSSDPELHLDGRGEQVNTSTQDWDRGVVSKRSEKSASHHPVKESAEQDAFFGDDDGDESSE